MAERQPVPTPPERKSPNGGEAAAKPRGETLVAERPAPEVKSVRKHASKARHVKKKRVRRRSASVRRPRMHAHAHAHVYEVRHERKAWRGRKRQRRAKVHRHRRAEVRGWSSGRVHVVRRGDTLSRISQRYYGSAGAYRSIYRANRHKLRSPHLIYPRQRLYIP
jgi:nucleoid-associated protein YgaU